MPLPLAVLAPHPDDEVIGAAALLRRVRGAAVLHLTDGAPRDPRLRPALPGERAHAAAVRRAEALAALAEIEVPPRRVIALGGVDQEAVAALPSLVRDLAAWLAAAQPRRLLVVPYEGGHPDHDAAAVAARAARILLRRAGRPAPRLWEMTSYHRGGGGVASGAFLEGGRWRTVRLDGAARSVKRRMLERHASQRAVLGRFGVEEERFRPAPRLHLDAPPHPRPLLYEELGFATFERFQAQARAGLAELEIVEAEL